MMVTIKDIAQLAGVSYSTVSKALNNSPLVNYTTKSNIIKIAKEIGYEPNFAAQQLVSKQSKIIGLIWPTLERVAPSTLVTLLNEEIARKSYSMILSINSVKNSIEMFKRFKVDGLIIFDENNQDSLENCPLPFVTYGVSKGKKYPVIDVNYQESMQIAIDYLYNLGHKKIAYIGDFSPIDDRQLEKYYSVQQVMKQLQIPMTSNNMVNTGGLGWYDGYLATKRLLSSTYNPTAIIGASYDISAGIIRALRESNIIIPKDISVISYDNIPQMTNLEIPLTSFGAPVQEIAYSMVNNLLVSINEKDTQPLVKTLTPTITERSSCARVSG